MVKILKKTLIKINMIINRIIKWLLHIGCSLKEKLLIVANSNALISSLISNKEIRTRLLSIICIIAFLTFSTWFVFGPRKKLVYTAMNINNSIVRNKNIIIKSNDTLNYNKKAYNFSVINKTNKKSNYEIILVNDYKKSILKKCKVLSNNYLKFNIKSENNYNIDRNVRINGIVYKGAINPKETKNFSIKLWLDKEKNNDDCYYPLLKVEEKVAI